MNSFKIFAMIGVAMFMLIGVVIFGYAIQASDYEASNNTGNATPYTNQTVMTYSLTTSWYAGLGILLFILIIGLILWGFFR